jgi:hypothetical protein
MWGRVGRAARQLAVDHRIVCFGVLHAYDPRRIAGVLAVGLGTAGGIGMGGQSVGQAVDSALAWGEHARSGYAQLPPRLLVIVTSEAVRVHDWSIAGAGQFQAVWAAETFRAQEHLRRGESTVRVILADGKVALLSGRSGFLHPQTRRLINSIALLASH